MGGKWLRFFPPTPWPADARSRGQRDVASCRWPHPQWTCQAIGGPTNHWPGMSVRLCRHHPLRKGTIGSGVMSPTGGTGRVGIVIPPRATRPSNRSYLKFTDFMAVTLFFFTCRGSALPAAVCPSYWLLERIASWVKPEELHGENPPVGHARRPDLTVRSCPNVSAGSCQPVLRLPRDVVWNNRPGSGTRVWTKPGIFTHGTLGYLLRASLGFTYLYAGLIPAYYSLRFGVGVLLAGGGRHSQPRARQQRDQ